MSQRCDCKFHMILVGLSARHLSGDDLPNDSSASRVSSQATFASAEDAPLCGLAEYAIENDEESIRWFVKSVSEEGHNHELDAADSLLAQYRTLPVAIKTQLAMYASTRAPQELHQLACDFGKNNDIPVTWDRKDIANYVMRFERTPLALQAQEMVDQCHALKASSEFFQFKVDFDNDSRRLVAISMIFDEGVRHWSRSADILLLDSTHGTNNAGMRLILYITLGSSLESIVLGMCLVDSEDQFNLKFAIESFVKLMPGRKPGVIFTDGDDVMRTACQRALPETQVLLDTWHLWQNVLRHMRSASGDAWHRFSNAFWSFLLQTDLFSTDPTVAAQEWDDLNKLLPESARGNLHVSDLKLEYHKLEPFDWSLLSDENGGDMLRSHQDALYEKVRELRQAITGTGARQELAYSSKARGEPYMDTLWRTRFLWARRYVHHWLTAGVHGTGRCESIHRVFKENVSRSTSLKTVLDFTMAKVENDQRAIRDKQAMGKEYSAESIFSTEKSYMLRCAHKRLWPCAFVMFFEQWREAKKFAYDSVSEIGAEESFLFVYQKDVMVQRMQESEYLVTCTDALDLFDDMSGRKAINAPVRKRAEFIVLCNKNRPYACSCQYYSRMGIPCAHMLAQFIADDDKRLESGGYNDPTPMFAASDGTDGAVARRWHSGWINQNEIIAMRQDRNRLGITSASDKNTNADSMSYFQQIPPEQRYGALVKEFQRVVGDGLVCKTIGETPM